MTRLALLNLIQNKTRLVISVGGLAFALALVLFFDAIFTGAMGRLTLYIDHSGADIWVSQQGVRTMHMSVSALPASLTDKVKAVPGVEDAVPILYASDMVRAGGSESPAYVFGVPADSRLGQPRKVVNGASRAGSGEVIIDDSIANKQGLVLGDSVTVLGQDLEIVGLMSGTASLVNSVSFVNVQDFARLMGNDSVISFVLVKVKPGESPSAVATRIRDMSGDVTVQTRQEFAAQERALVQDMSAEIISIMNVAGFLTGLAVMALTVYIATIARRREYGVLKAIGTRSRHLYSIVLIQAFLSVGMGLIAGLALTLLLSALLPRVSESLVLSISTASLLRVTIVSIVLAGIAALLPAMQIARVEPVSVMRKG